MKTWALFYPDVLPEIPGVPMPMVDHWLRNAAIEFCERTKAHVVTLDPVNAVADQMGYALPLDANTELVQVVAVKFSGDKLTPKSPGFLEKKYDDWESETGTPEHYTQAATDILLLVPAPDTAETDAIAVRAAIKPGTEATGIHDWLFSQYRKAIGAGALAGLLSMNKPWADPNRALLNQAKFEAAIETAAPAATDGHVQAVPRFSGSFC
jgi:hypothetical protein